MLLLLTTRLYAAPEPREGKAQTHQLPRGVVPPRLASTATVAYPERGQGRATVVLALTIDKRGGVQSARLLSGDAPFASAALDAARSWRFTPAMRDGRPISAIIRFRVQFEPPESEPAPTGFEPAPDERAALSRPQAGAGSASAATPIEIVVRGEAPAPAKESLSHVEVRQLPGAFGDALRAVDVMPGVTPIVSGAPYFYVRGAPPGNIGYFVDGVRIPYLYHFALGPSVIHPAIVENVDLYAGGYPARYGRFAGAIIAAETRAPRPEFWGEGNVRLFDAGAVAEAPFASGDGSALVAGRYSYTGALVSLFAPEVKIDYRDYQARVSYDLGPRDRVSLFSFGTYDLLGDVRNDVVNVFFGSEFYRADLRYDHQLAEDGAMRFAVTLGFDQTRISEDRNGQTRLFGSRLEVERHLGDELELRSGADFTLESYASTSLAYDDPENPEVQKRDALFPARNDIAVGGFFELPVRATRDVEVTPGVRVDLFTSGLDSALGVDPRIAARYQVSDSFRIVHAFGIAHQPPSFIAPLPGLTPGTLSKGLQTSVQSSAGAEFDLPSEVTSGVTFFQNIFLNMSDAIGTSADIDVASTDLQVTPDERSLGSCRGAEVFLRRSFAKRLGGFLSYTLSRSQRSLGRESFPSNFDRTHVANAALSYDLGRNWRAGTRVLFYTGTPKRSQANGLIVGPRPSDPGRSPPFYRLDFRIEKRWRLGERSWLAFVAEVLNATLSKETLGSASGQDQVLGPITIPSIGLEGGL